MKLRYIHIPGALRICGILLPLMAAATAAQAYTVTVESDYGATAVDGVTDTAVAPTVGQHQKNAGETIPFKAPEYVYLDQYRRELKGEDGAHYRAQCTGWDIDGNGTTFLRSQGASQPGFSVTITQNVTVVWNWKLQNAVFIAVEGDHVAELVTLPGDMTVGAEPTGQGRYWVDDQGSANASILGEITAGLTPGERFRPIGFTTEGAGLDSADRYVTFSGNGDRIVGPRGSYSVPPRISWYTYFAETEPDLTWEFWAKRSPDASGDMAVLNLFESYEDSMWL